MSRTAIPTLRTSHDALPEVVFVPPGDNAASQRALRLRKQGRLRPLYSGVFSANLRAADEDVVRRNWSAIVAHLAPGAVVSHRSAFDMAPHDGVVYLSRAQGRREHALPGLVVKSLVKPERGPVLNPEHPGAADVPYQGLYVASRARAYLESLTADKRLQPRQLARAELEEHLLRLLTLRGERALNGLRDEAREVAERLAMPAEFRQLDAAIGALLGTRAVPLASARAQARAANTPFDAERLALFEKLHGQLHAAAFADLAEPARQGPERDLFAFVEAYFSNYIEGTTFTVEEAQDIVFKGKVFVLRQEDTHDIKGTFEAAQRDPFYSRPPTSAAGLQQWLQQANALVMRGRPDKTPGQWKAQANQAGTTLFVLPELVPETLVRAWPLLQGLKHPMQQALMAMFIVAEVHPFADGNGRTARLLMNCFLSSQAHARIIVPTLFREDYLLALKALTHQADATAYIRAMRLCQAWSTELDYANDVAQMNRQLEACNAKKEDTRLFRLLSPATGQPMQVP